MKKTNGYKGMLRDRCPTVVDYALKWQKAKERWIDHVYTHFINVFVDKEERKKATRLVLCIKYTHTKQARRKHIKEEQHFDFHKSIDWENLNDEEITYWIRVESWVTWFCTTYSYIQNEWEISLKCGKDEFETKVRIINKFLKSLLPNEDDTKEVKTAKFAYVDKLVDFLFRCFNEQT